MKEEREQLFVGGLGSIANSLEKLARNVRSLEGRMPIPSTELFTALERAKRHYRNRRRRDSVFESSNLFGEPAWDMLVDLFIASEEGNLISVSSLCIASAVPSTTALRWIAILEQENLIMRTPDSDDRRRIFVSLTETALSRITAYFER